MVPSYLMTNQELIAVVLQQVNRGRAAFNGGPLDCLPHGDPRMCLSCPIKLGLDTGFLRVAVSNDYIRVHGRANRIRLAEALGTSIRARRHRKSVFMTEAMVEFIDRFDRGDIPELIDDTCGRQPTLAA